MLNILAFVTAELNVVCVKYDTQIYQDVLRSFKGSLFSLGPVRTTYSLTSVHEVFSPQLEAKVSVSTNMLLNIIFSFL